MMKSKVTQELQWLEDRAEEIRQYVDANPYHLVEDRTTTAYTKGGDPYQVVVQKIEAIHKSLRDSLKEYGQLIEQIDKLREREEAKLEARGGKELNSRMKKLMKS